MHQFWSFASQVILFDLQLMIRTLSNFCTNRDIICTERSRVCDRETSLISNQGCPSPKLRQFWKHVDCWSESRHQTQRKLIIHHEGNEWLCLPNWCEKYLCADRCWVNYCDISVLCLHFIWCCCALVSSEIMVQQRVTPSYCLIKNEMHQC